MYRIRRTLIAIAGFVAATLAALTAAPAAFAVRVVPPGGAKSASTYTTTSGSGMATWEVAAICIAVALLMLALTTALSRVRAQARVRPAVH